MKKTLIGLVVAVGILVLLLRQVDLPQLSTALLEVRPGLLMVGLAAQLIVMWIKSIRWAIVLQGVTGRPVRRAFGASMIGFAGNVLLPARLGELARVSVIEKHNQIGRPLALTTVGLTQLFDLLTLVGYFLVISFWATNLFTAHRWTIGLLGVLAVLILGGLVILQQKSQRLRTLLLPIRSKLPDAIDRRVTRYVDLFMKGLSVLRKGHVVGWMLLLTISVWSLETVAAYLMLQAFHIKATLLMAAMLVVMLNLSFAFPITPGNVGIYQAVGVLSLGAFGVAQEFALAYSIGVQATTYLIIVSVGMMCFYREEMSLNMLGQAAREGVSRKSANAMEI